MVVATVVAIGLRKEPEVIERGGSAHEYFHLFFYSRFQKLSLLLPHGESGVSPLTRETLPLAFSTYPWNPHAGQADQFGHLRTGSLGFVKSDWHLVSFQPAGEKLPKEIVMTRKVMLVPRNGHTVNALAVCRISGCVNQTELSLDDQFDHLKQEVEELFDGPIEFHIISTKAKGERLDRPEIAQIEELIRSGQVDVILMEDVSRMARGTVAKDLWGLAIDHGVRCIAPNDGIDSVDSTWEEDLISACAHNVGHCANTSRRIKHKQMNRFRRNGGAIPLTVFGYIKPEGAKYYSEIRKDETVSPFLQEGLNILRRTRSWAAVADYFNRNQVPTGPHCRNSDWNGAMVKRLYHNPILKGKPQRGAKHSVKKNETGKRVSVVNPDGPTYRDEPHLAHFDAAELDSVLADVDAHHSRLGRRKASSGDRVHNTRKRTRFPGQCAKCWYCGRDMVWGGNGIRDNLMCNGSREHHCWSSIAFNGELAAQLVMEEINSELIQLSGFEDQFAELVRMAQVEHANDDRELQELEKDEVQHGIEKANLSTTILKLGHRPHLEAMLTDLEQRGSELARRRELLERRRRERPVLPQSAAELRQLFDEVSRELAQNSFEFGDILRSLVTDFHVYNVQLIDGGHLLPRAKVKLNLGAIVPDIDRAPGLKEFLYREFTIDLFDPPTRVKIREEVVRQSALRIKQRDIAASLGTHQATVQRALKLDRMMRERGLTSPYELVTAPPRAETNKKLKRSRHALYSFKPLEGYEPLAL